MQSLLGIKRAAVLVAAAAFALAGDAGLPTGVEARGKLLVAAVRAGDNQRVVELLNGGANPNTKDESGTPVLMLSAIYGSAASMQTLLDRGADPNATNAAGASALHYAAVDTAKTKLLVAKGADVNAHSGPGSHAAAGRCRCRRQFRSGETVGGQGRRCERPGQARRLHAHWWRRQHAAH